MTKSKVYFIPIKSITETAKINKAVKRLLDQLKEDSSADFHGVIPIKTHFGEQGNTTYIKPENFYGILDFIKENGGEPAFIETNVLYKGERTTKQSHLRLAAEHGFTMAPVIIADGDHGESYMEVEINKKHFKSCKLGKEYKNFDTMIVASHFKGHILAGFGGAIKQLAMGCASRGGKLAQHDNAVPVVNKLKCTKCGTCARECPAAAITLSPKAKINPKTCIGCASCMAVCHFDAISNNWAKSLLGNFHERMTEYAYAAALNKKLYYISFALNITKLCDCDGSSMKPITGDIGIFASTDPVAIDSAALHAVNQSKKIFRNGERTLIYGEEIGLGTRNYELTELSL